MLLLGNNTKPVLFRDLFDDFFTFPFETPTIMQPIHDIIENDNEFLVKFHLAGIKKEDTSIDVDKNTLTIKAERKEVKDVKYNRKESFIGMYQKSFTLPETVDKDNIQASFEDGVLTTILPKIKKEEKKLSKKQIQIQ